MELLSLSMPQFNLYGRSGNNRAMAPKFKKRKRVGKRWRSKRALTIGAALSTAVVLVVFLAATMARDSREIKVRLEKAKAAVSESALLIKGGKSREGKERLTSAQEELSEAQRLLQIPGPRLVSSIPVVGNSLRAVEGIVVVGQRSIRAGAELADLYAELERAKRSWIKTGEMDLTVFAKAEERLGRAGGEMRAAREDETEIPKTFLIPPVAKARRELEWQIKAASAAIEKGRMVAKILPAILGGDGRREYFLAVQNNAELRATGGLIGNYGIISVDHGKLALERFDEIHALRKPDAQPVEAPRDFVERHATLLSTSPSLWLNANMSPDFPTSAAIVASLYKASTGKQANGVIAVDPVGLSYLLRATGPVKLPDLGVTVGSSNAVKWTLSDTYADFDERSDRKDSLRHLAEAVWAKMLSGSFSNAGELASALGRALDEKHLMVYLVDPEEERKIKSLGYGGETKRSTGDYLLVDVENYGMNKVDYYLKESVSHDVELQEGGRAKMSTSVTLYNRAPNSGLTEYVAGKASPGAPAGTNEAYLSIFVPKESRLKLATLNGLSSTVEVAPELDKTVFSILAKIPPGGKSVFRFEYEVPKALTGGGSDREYSLIIQKQPMVNDAEYAVSVTGSIFTPLSGDFRSEGSRLKAAGKLSSDVTLKELFKAE